MFESIFGLTEKLRLDFCSDSHLLDSRFDTGSDQNSQQSTEDDRARISDVAVPIVPIDKDQRGAAARLVFTKTQGADSGLNI